MMSGFDNFHVGFQRVEGFECLFDNIFRVVFLNVEDDVDDLFLEYELISGSACYCFERMSNLPDDEVDERFVVPETSVIGVHSVILCVRI